MFRTYFSFTFWKLDIFLFEKILPPTHNKEPSTVQKRTPKGQHNIGAIVAGVRNERHDVPSVTSVFNARAISVHLENLQDSFEGRRFFCG